MTGEEGGVPTVLIDGCVAAQAALLADIADLSDDVARRPSLLPGWSVGHLLTHIARNADSMTWRLEGAALGELRDQYPGGLEQRSSDIENGAGRPAAELVADVRQSADALERIMAELPPAAWDAPSRTSRGVVEDFTRRGAVALARGGGASRGPRPGPGPLPARLGRRLAAAGTATSGGTE